MHHISAVALLASLAALPSFACAQDKDNKLAPPSAGLLVSYTYWPTQYVQWVGAELPYAMIELDVDTAGKQPLLYLTLTSRTDGKRIHYTNNDGLVAYAKAQGEEAHKTEMAFEDPGSQSPGAISSVRLTLADGKPLQWRFVQGSDISEQGSGLTPLPAAKVPIFVYREQGAVAGEGTALQIGNVVSTAEMWKEISHPPQFIAYHAALTSSAHTIAFIPGKEDWTVVSAPAALTPGAAWELDSATGNHRTLKIDKVDGNHIMLSGSDRFQPAVRFTLETTHNADNTWSLQSARYAPVREGVKHFALLQMASPLPSTGTDEITLAVGKRKIAAGTIAVSGTAAEQTLTLDFASPAWVHGKALTETTQATGDALSIAAHP